MPLLESTLWNTSSSQILHYLTLEVCRVWYTSAYLSRIEKYGTICQFPLQCLYFKVFQQARYYKYSKQSGNTRKLVGAFSLVGLIFEKILPNGKTPGALSPVRIFCANLSLISRAFLVLLWAKNLPALETGPFLPKDVAEMVQLLSKRSKFN